MTPTVIDSKPATTDTSATTTATTVPAGVTTTGPRSAGSSVATAPSGRGALTWVGCGKGLDCSTLAVPLDYANPSTGTIMLFLKRRSSTSTKRIGTLLMNPGGPGVAGTPYIDEPSSAFSKALATSFDLVSWDPRGTGQSTPAIDCVDDLDPYLSLDPSPDTPAELEALKTSAQAFDAACQKRSGPLLAHLSTQDAARDIDEIRKALGDDKITYLGFSYGSELGATYATMFPERVRAMVLDGAADPEGNTDEWTRTQLTGLERTLDLVLSQCSANKKCKFHNDGRSEQAYDELMAGLDSHPLIVASNRPGIGQGVATIAVVSALYNKSFWPLLTQALADAQRGDGRLLLAMYDDYIHRPVGGGASPEFQDLIAVTCLDDPGVTDPAAMAALAAPYAALAPRLGPSSVYGFDCTYWPVPPIHKLALTGRGAGPILVVGTTGDPITPLASSRKMAQALEGGELLTVEAEQHTGYQANSCSRDTIDHYLIALVMPAPETICR